MNKVLQAVVPDNYVNWRVDQAAASLFPEFSRARLQGWIKSQALTLDGNPCRSKDKLQGGEWLQLEVMIDSQTRWLPQDLAIDERYSDEHLIVIHKPAGLVVHPGAGVADGTLLNGLLYHYPELAALPRAGIVHRLDKDTTGLMVVARSLLAHTHLVQQLQSRHLGREYEAIVVGELTGGGCIEQAIGRHRTQRTKMAVLPASHAGAKEAITHYRLLQRFTGFTHVACRLETGRTHQIRVHFAHLRHPLLGDPVYLGRRPLAAPKALRPLLASFQRQALHARRLSLVHPATAEQMSWESCLPEDFAQVLAGLSAYAGVK